MLWITFRYSWHFPNRKKDQINFVFFALWLTTQISWESRCQVAQNEMRCDEEEKIYFHLSQKYFYSKSRYILHWPPLLFTSPNFFLHPKVFSCVSKVLECISLRPWIISFYAFITVKCKGWFFALKFKFKNETFWVLFSQSCRKYHRSKSWSKKLIFWPPTTLRSARFFGRTLVSSRKNLRNICNWPMTKLIFAW